MQKQSKWLKWEVGAASTIALAMIFNTARSDPAFAIANHKVASLSISPTEQTNQADPVFNEWSNQQTNSQFSIDSDTNSQQQNSSAIPSNQVRIKKKHTRTMRIRTSTS